MADCLDMSLDDIIRKNRNKSSTCLGLMPLDHGHFRARGRGRGRDCGPGPGPMRRCANRAPPRAMPYNNTPYLVIRECGTQMFNLQPLALVGIGEKDGSGTKLYISNLDHGVSNKDMKLLFSDVGVLKGHAVHYDRNGKSKGTAEVVFVHKVDAVAAVERYNGVHLDGKPMKIELVGVNVIAPAPFSYPNAKGILGNPGYCFRRQERGGGRGGYRGGVGRGIRKELEEEGRSKKVKKVVVSAKELDADLEKYRLEAPLRNY